MNGSIVPANNRYLAEPHYRDYVRGFASVIGNIHEMRKRRFGFSRSNGRSSKRYRTSGGGRPSGNTNGVTPVSSQYNVSRIQRAGRLGRGGKKSIRRFKRFKAKVRAAMSADVPNSFVVRQSTRYLFQNLSVIPSAEQTVNGVSFMDNALITQAFVAEGLDFSVNSEDQLALKGGSCELVLQHAGMPGYVFPAQVDVYLCQARKNIASAYDSEAWQQWEDSVNEMANFGNNPTIYTWGVTPFEAPSFVKNWKIAQTWRLTLAPGQQPTTLEKTFSFRNKRVMGTQVGANKQLKGTYAWIIVLKGTPREVGEGDGMMNATDLNVRYNQVLHYEKFDPSSAARAKNV